MKAFMQILWTCGALIRCELPTDIENQVLYANERDNLSISSNPWTRWHATILHWAVHTVPSIFSQYCLVPAKTGLWVVGVASCAQQWSGLNACTVDCKWCAWRRQPTRSDNIDRWEFLQHHLRCYYFDRRISLLAVNQQRKTNYHIIRMVVN